MKSQTSQFDDLFTESFPTLSETGTPDRCRKCGSAIWKAYCRTGFRTYLDTAPVTPAQDLEFYLSRRRTFRLWRTGKGWEINFRSPELILGSKASDVVLTEHRCDQFATDWPDYFRKPTTTTDSEEVPF